MNRIVSGRPATATACVLLLLATCVVYVPVLNCGFIWDDDSYLTNNRLVTESGGLGRVWFEPGPTPQYYPMVFTSFLIEHSLWGLNPVGYHAVNVLLHAACACLFGWLLQRLRVPGSWLAAGLFAIHPVAVESVAWITERKNTLSLLFYLLAFHCYLSCRSNQSSQKTQSASQWPDGHSSDGNSAPSGPSSGMTLRGVHYAAFLLFFVCALLSKSITCSLPAAILVVTWWSTGRLSRQDCLCVLPAFVIGVISAGVTVSLETHHVGTSHIDWRLTPVDRCLIAGRALWFYAAKILWPTSLSFIYPRWEINSALWWQWLFPAVALAVPISCFLFRRRIGRGPIAAVLLFGETLIPALGFIDVYPMRFSFVADHFQYLASLALFSLFGSGLFKLHSWLVPERVPAKAAWVAGTCLMLMFGVMSWHQCGIYTDTESLWEDTLQENPSCQLANTNLALIRMGQQQLPEARRLLATAIKSDPEFDGAWLWMGVTLRSLGDTAGAEEHLRQALALNPNRTEAHLHLGLLQEQIGQPEEAVHSLHEALARDPTLFAAAETRAFALQSLERYDEAVLAFQYALTLQPQNGLTWYNLGVCSDRAHQSELALAAYEKAVLLRPEDPLAHFNLGNLYARAGLFDSAIGHFEAALRVNPNFQQAAENLATARRDLMRRRRP